MRSLMALLTAAGMLLPMGALAQTIPLVTSSPMANGDTEYALGIQILMVMTVLTLLPAMLITMTAFTRILIVLAILRQALGTAQTPSNQIILGLSLFLTLFIMSPVIDVVWISSLSPYLDGDVPFDEALNMAQVPLREFMFVDDCADGIIFLMKEYSDISHINLGYGSEISILDLAMKIKEIVGFSGIIVFDEKKPDGIERKLLNSKKVYDLGWKPKVNLDDGLQKTYEDFVLNNE